MDAEVSIFQQDQTTITQEDLKGFTWHKHSLKHKKHNHNSSIIVQTLKNRNKKIKINLFIGLAPNKRYRFTPLARHNAKI